jgi:hypothetical protein
MTQQFREQKAMKKAFHPTSSPDLAPSDFHFFGHVKQFLTGQEFPDEKALISAIKLILAGIENLTMGRVFLEWMERFRKCIETRGECMD